MHIKRYSVSFLVVILTVTLTAFGMSSPVTAATPSSGPSCQQLQTTFDSAKTTRQGARAKRVAIQNRIARLNVKLARQKKKRVKAKAALKKARAVNKLAQAKSARVKFNRHKKRIQKLKTRKRKAVVNRKNAHVAFRNAKAAAKAAKVAWRACEASRAEVVGPITGGDHGFPATTTSVDLEALGYAETEYFLSGKATSYVRDGAWTSSGTWAVTPESEADYTTRLLVRAPQDPADFNGTVLVEWLNVTGNSDADVEWPYMYSELTRQGYAWVGVSAQWVGVHAQPGASTVGEDVAGMTHWDPTRYAQLTHPGDEFSYDIFSQAGQALLAPRGVDPLPGMNVRHLIAAGQSQSASRMITYANAIQPVAGVYDGIIIHARSGINAPLGEGIQSSDRDGANGPDTPTPVRVRTDSTVPVMQLISETELFETGSGPSETMFTAARQPDTRMIRTWELAGTAHSDVHLVEFMNDMYLKMFAGARDLSPVFPLINAGPQAELSAAALRAMRKWITDGVAPTSAMPIQTADGTIVRDKYGNALGGVRSPAVDVPTATLSGETTMVPLNGFTTRFSPEQLHDMYGSNAGYVGEVAAAATSAVSAGFLVPEDAAKLITAAVTSGIGDKP